MDVNKIGDRDLYELFGLSHTCTTAEIKKAYRKKALECHPDKNPDNPKAGELFKELTDLIAILLDESARAAYDKILNARKAAKLRHKEYDDRRKKFKEDLEYREAQYFSNKESAKTDEEKLKKEIERLQTEGAKLLEDELKLLQEEVARSMNERIPESGSDYKIKIEWVPNDKEESCYTKEALERIFYKYGDLVAVVCSENKGKGRGIVEFKEKSAAELAMKLEMGFVKCPLKLKWMNEDGKSQKRKPAAAVGGSDTLITERDYESLVLRKMRQAEERKRLIEEMQGEDD
ncbi:UNVERIFIED_CONTAM: hypothetical protein PYX00_003588 [Menopon gallinae]|uniref:Uncharacterized protein n=1 Tax=Menopon gallinae TaxID=328185 RepID=A0AAW2I0Z5_9NEOP